MRSVQIAQKGLIDSVKDGSIFSKDTVKQDKTLEIRYSKNKEFTDEVARNFLNRNVKINSNKFLYPDLINPVFG
jgi:hypothetical protein